MNESILQDNDILQKISINSDEEVAESILDLKDHRIMIKVIQLIEDNFTNRWSNIHSKLKQSLVLHPQPIYTHRNVLNNDKLQLIKYLFRKQSSIDPSYFKQDSVYILLAVAEGFLMQELAVQKINRVRQLFVKNLHKEGVFWGLSDLQNIQAYIVDKSGFFLTYSQPQHDSQMDRIIFFFTFYEKYPDIFPQTMDIMAIFFKLMLCLRDEKQRDRQLFAKIKECYFRSRYHFHSTIKNMKFAMQFYRNSFNQKQCLYNPQKIILTLLSNYSTDEIDAMLSGTSIGLIWSQCQVNNYFVNCIKQGITQYSSRLMIGMIKFCQKYGRFNELLYAYECNITKIFIFMKHSKFFTTCLSLIKYFIYSPPPTQSLYQKFIQKVKIFIIGILPQLKFPFLNLLQTVAFYYKQTKLTNQLDQLILTHMTDTIDKLTEEQIKNELEQYSWKTKFKKTANWQGQKNSSQFKGLTNIGNSCYMNSFIQSLFMNKQFTRDIITMSTLQLSKDRMKDKQFQGKTADFISKRMRQDLIPLVELQKLFALLLKSKRNQINPNIIKAVSPEIFRNNFQHDTSEFGRMFLDMLYKNKIPHIFQGEMVTSIECEGCGKIRERKEIFLDYIIFPEQGQQDLQQLLKLSFKEEVVDDLICDYCNERRKKSVKRHNLSKLPNYMIITIKRFNYCVKQNKNSKIMSKVNIKNIVVIEQEQYQIYSIIVHRGLSPNAGHYFVFSKINFDQNSKWVCHNDSVVTEHQSFAQITQILDNNESDTPYVLFYQKTKYISQNRQTLIQKIQLRQPQEEYVMKEDSVQQKSQQLAKKKQFLQPVNFNFMSLFKKDDDDQGPNNGGNFYNSYIS